MFWPSFNSMPGGEDDPGRYLAVMNTYLALAGACMMTYATSIWCTPGRRITMEHVQNATLAGGVAMGSAASMPVTPFGAIIIGALAGVLSTCGYSYIKVDQKLEIPGVLKCIFSPLFPTQSTFTTHAVSTTSTACPLSLEHSLQSSVVPLATTLLTSKFLNSSKF